MTKRLRELKETLKNIRDLKEKLFVDQFAHCISLADRSSNSMFFLNADDFLLGEYDPQTQTLWLSDFVWSPLSDHHKPFRENHTLIQERTTVWAKKHLKLESLSSTGYKPHVWPEDAIAPLT